MFKLLNAAEIQKVSHAKKKIKPHPIWGPISSQSLPQFTCVRRKKKAKKIA